MSIAKNVFIRGSYYNINNAINYFEMCIDIDTTRKIHNQIAEELNKTAIYNLEIQVFYQLQVDTSTPIE